MRDSALLLYLVRHGRTHANTDGLLQGWSDTDLTPDGLAGVRATARYLAPVPFTAAYTSPLGRTRATAHEILTHHPDVQVSDHAGLKEFSFGDLELLPESALFSRVDPVDMFREVFEGTFAGLPGGEPAQMYLDRVTDAFTTIEQRHRGGGPVLVVSHGVTLMVYLTLHGAVPMQALANASVTVVAVHPDGRREVRAVGIDPSGHGDDVPDLPQDAAVAGDLAAHDATALTPPA